MHQASSPAKPRKWLSLSPSFCACLNLSPIPSLVVVVVLVGGQHHRPEALPHGRLPHRLDAVHVDGPHLVVRPPLQHVQDAAGSRGEDAVAVQVVLQMGEGKGGGKGEWVGDMGGQKGEETGKRRRVDGMR